ncbi:uncharacterized protein [Rutidosis leptorrhynchoides]|uniref:uncharacterized protein n=1 Tax=Rutidosis leptorrhynchoides TaxID=125765 RepID=UPI003A98FC13
MAEEKYDLISEIDNVKSSWKLKVRVLRIWKTLYELQMIVMDEKCHKIGVVVKKVLCPEFENDLQEGGVYILTNFGVGDNKGSYPVYMHKWKLNFYRNTTLRRVSSFDGPDNDFQFLPFSQVSDKKDETNLLVDVIGKVVDSGDVKPYDKDDGGEGKSNLKLCCTFWDDYAQQMHDFIAGNKSLYTPVLIIQFGRVKYWKVKKELSIQNAYYCTKLLFNSDLPEVVEFRKTLISKFGTASSSQGASQLSSKVKSFRDEFLSMPKMTIGEIIDATKPITCVVLATITCVEERCGWSYIACRKCKKKVIKKSEHIDLENKEDSVGKNLENDGKLYCPGCECYASSVFPSFKIQARVRDGSGNASFVMFEREVTKLLRTTAAEVREKQLQDEDEVTFPEVFVNLKEKRVLFMISVSKNNIDTLYHVYTVSKVCNDPSIMAEFDNNQPGDDDDDQGNDHGGAYEEAGNTKKECLLIKDVVSCTDESSNALEATSETAASPIKRPHEAVDDDKTIGQNSSTKKKLLPVKIEK